MLYKFLTSWRREKQGVEAGRSLGRDPVVHVARENALGQLVWLGFGISTFTPATYQRLRLRRPLREISSWGGFRT